jgi:hypothetical protein
MSPRTTMGHPTLEIVGNNATRVRKLKREPMEPAASDN